MAAGACHQLEGVERQAHALVVVADILRRLLQVRKGCLVVSVPVSAGMGFVEHKMLLLVERKMVLLQAQEAVDRMATGLAVLQERKCLPDVDSPILAAVFEGSLQPKLAASQQEPQASS